MGTEEIEAYAWKTVLPRAFEEEVSDPDEVGEYPPNGSLREIRGRGPRALPENPPPLPCPAIVRSVKTFRTSHLRLVLIDTRGLSAM